MSGKLSVTYSINRINRLCVRKKTQFVPSELHIRGVDNGPKGVAIRKESTAHFGRKSEENKPEHAV